MHRSPPIIPDLPEGSPHSHPATAARAPIEPSPTRCKYVGCGTQSRRHHVTVAQPRIMDAASSAIHLIGRHEPWGFQPSFHAILVSYTLLMSLYWLQDR